MRWLLPVFLVAGCQTDGSVDLDETTNGPGSERGITWYDDVGPLLVDRCGSCHQDGGIGVFSMESYEQVKPWAAAISDAIDTGRMPPWAATETDSCTQDVPFRDDPRLTDAEKQLVRDWVAADAPAGEPKTLTLPDLGDLVDPSVVVGLQEPFAVSGNRDIYQCFRIEVPHDTDVWIQEMQVLPDNDAVVHHVLVWNDPENRSASMAGPDGSYPCSGEPGFYPTDMIGGWAPGQPVVRNPEGTGGLFKAGSSIVVNVHYHPVAGSTELDQTQIALKWTTEKPANYVTYYLVDRPFGANVEDGNFFIPAGEANHREILTFDPYRYLPLPIDLPIFAIMPHMHYRGTDMMVTLEDTESGEDECLINARGYRFDYQNTYYYDVDRIEDMPAMSPGEEMRIRCTYDNSWDNPFMAEALEASGDPDLIDVGWGEETGDEMCMAVVGIVIPPVDISEWL